MHVYEVRPRKDKRGVDLISDVLPFGRLWYGDANAIGYAQFYSRSHDTVIRVYDESGNVIEWYHFLVSSRPPKLKAWESCKTQMLESWAASRPDKSEAFHRFMRNHIYSFGATSSGDRFEDHDSRNTAVSDAGVIGVSEDELIQIDRRIANECGAFPRQ